MLLDNNNITCAGGCLMLLSIVTISLLLSLSPTIALSNNNIDAHVQMLQKMITYGNQKNNLKKIRRQRNHAQRNNKTNVSDNKLTQQDLLNYAYAQFKNPSISNNNDQVADIIHDLETKKFQTDLLFDGLSQACDIMSSQTKKDKKRRFFNILGLIFRVVAQMTKK